MHRHFTGHLEMQQILLQVLEIEKPISHDYVLQINNKWYVDVNKYVEAYNTNQIEAGQELLSKGFIRQKLGSSSLATLVRRQKAKSVVCFELTPLGQSSLTGAVKSSSETKKSFLLILFPKYSSNFLITYCLVYKKAAYKSRF